MYQHNRNKYAALLMIIGGAFAFLATAILGIVYDSNLWPPAAILYGFLSAVFGFLIGSLIDFVLQKLRKRD